METGAVRRLAFLLLLALASCGSEEPGPTAAPPAATSTATTAEGTTTAPATRSRAAEALPGLPPWTAGYREWTRLTDEPLPPRDADPHLGTKTVYASKPATGGTFPADTVIVKEAFRPGKDFIGLIATMRKEPGADPEHGDWVFVEWARDAEDEAFTELARDAVCWTCHMGVADRDYVFTNE